ncbi:hypothetical protein BpHYR1_018242 [Brachionus plicatilis]|uniref:Uncharacterized protein n=1 Tax=Brachionus plicatilis TaxID=10195 RepID=A0A3M7QW95_BRAPC|nr:hypothetical protein BpHYR1_018242 [Brachionus plicatilis]
MNFWCSEQNSSLTHCCLNKIASLYLINFRSYSSPQNIGQSVNVLANFLVLATVFDINPGSEKKKACPEDKIEQERKRA